jgi:serine/threonine protein kinase
MINTLIDGEYLVESCLGEGGFGIVYRCREVRLHRTVAVKMLRPTGLGEKGLQRFETEGRNLALLEHPNVVRVYRQGTHEGAPYIVMEYLSGVTLQSYLSATRPPPATALSIMTQIASGLAAIHGKGLVHRDLSTNNVMITADGTAKILDLGFSKDLDSLSRLSEDGLPIGTIPYLAPEQIEGAQATCGSDIFSFGVMLYEAVVGAHPFAAEHRLSIIYNIAHIEPAPLSDFVQGIPDDLPALVAGCMVKDPSARLRNVLVICERLRRITATLDPGAVSGPAIPIPTIVRVPRPGNPYLNRVMIKRREDFFGREQEVRRIFARLNSSPPGSISIIGDRRVGKSSLINYLCMRPVREMHLSVSERFVMISMDLQERRSLDLTSFIHALLGVAALELRGRIDVSDCPPTLDGLKGLVQRLDREGYSLAILFDEFGVIAGNSHFDLEFFSFLRYLANHYNVAYVTSSARDLQTLCHSKEIPDSPFFNIFATLRLSGFRLEEAEELIRVPSEGTGHPLTHFRDQIIELAGLLPLFLQIACSHSLEFLEENPSRNDLDMLEVRKRFHEEARPHFQYIWDTLPDHEKAAIYRIGERRATAPSQRDVLEELERRSLICLDGKHPRLFGTGFQGFVRRTAALTRKGSCWGRLFGKD